MSRNVPGAQRRNSARIRRKLLRRALQKLEEMMGNG